MKVLSPTAWVKVTSHFQQLDIYVIVRDLLP